MGYIRHHAIIVTSTCEISMEKARIKAAELFGLGQVTQILPPAINGYMTFFVGPDGSKEGWLESDGGDNLRMQFIDWCNDPKTKIFVEVAEVQYYDEAGIHWVRRMISI